MTSEHNNSFKCLVTDISQKMKLVKQQNIKNPLFSIVIPIRNRYGIRVWNCLKSFQLQTLRELEIIVVDYGSTKENHEKLMNTLNSFDCSVFYYETNDLWSLSIARNIGIRRAQSNFVAPLDVDCIVEPTVIEETLKRFHINEKYFIVNLVCHCPKELNVNSLELPKDFKLLRKRCKCTKQGIGAYISASRDWWFKVRGFDERIKIWGTEDDDIKKRALDNGKIMIVLRLGSPPLFIYHQWHPQVERGKDFDLWEQRNLKILKDDDSIERNTKNWGCFNG